MDPAKHADSEQCCLILGVRVSFCVEDQVLWFELDDKKRDKWLACISEARRWGARFSGKQHVVRPGSGVGPSLAG